VHVPGPVAQGQSKGLITSRSQVRILPGPQVTTFDHNAISVFIGFPREPEEVQIDAAELARRIADTASNELATDILVLDIQHLSTITDYFVIASVDNVRQLRATAEAIEHDLRDNNDVRTSRREGQPDSGWMVLDYPGVLVHLMIEEQRDFYRLENLWADAHRLLVIQ
jgi:ribosome-associated protein